MLAKVELTMDCSDAVELAAFWRDAVGYADVPPPAPFTTQAEYLATTIDEDTDDGLRVAYLYDRDSNAPSLCLLEVPIPKATSSTSHEYRCAAPGGGPILLPSSDVGE
ncbi:MAG TPA: hypothetical protein VIM10_15410 [Actinopolymorphaceae bacterium]|jgi:hypothetical protein